MCLFVVRWMNKLGLASLDDLELTSATLTAGFWKPREMMTPETRKSLTQSTVGQDYTLCERSHAMAELLPD